MLDRKNRPASGRLVVLDTRFLARRDFQRHALLRKTELRKGGIGLLLLNPLQYFPRPKQHPLDVS
jgi:hypothetical protein